MNTNKTRDKIDSELRKTYFGTSPSKMSSSKINSNRIAPSNTKRLFITITVIVVLIVLTFIFVVQKKISFTVNINVASAQKSKVTAQTNNKGSINFAKQTSPEAIRKTVPASDITKDANPLYSFDLSEEGWGVPSWAIDKPEYVAQNVSHAKVGKNENIGCLEIIADFPGDKWTAAIFEVQHFLDLSDYSSLSADIYLPSSAPPLRGKLILTVGDDWKFTEMSKSFRLNPGEWTKISASLSDESKDWKRTVVTEAFRKDVRKIAIRIESNRPPAYSGPIYVDNVSVK